MERQNGVNMKKGPWTAEEDEILVNYVNKFGPRDWSSLRSKGLLPRTGKSCRLRWVNRLQPNLKTGCKFSAEEERVVIELQAQFGNKWAKIATYLEGRTDNDVKNFWSTRRKRLERILQIPPQKSQKKKQRSLEPQGLYELPALEVPSSSSSQLDEQSSTMENENQVFGTPSTHMLAAPFDPFSHCCISQFTHSSQEIGMFPDCHGLAPNHAPFNLQDVFEPGEPSETNSSHATADDCFDDFTADLFDFFDQPPPSLN